ncbi:hypothetical protein TC41_3089 [Alicyclobacillus acidocaldarius subsp. acidocaldarius Tc-4-1]|uniref:Uncharacterized protein n=1 Tax=Alicyclobacillus acidocaldarius (strain Tc-4-1) TaxID=1048834 RepID=F8ICW8_ALIAT|nr:hypothetical protein TC41_3089 [Alicyclobacillus acidocaldarius subsp. acidocaldarius Tc-4-1]
MTLGCAMADTSIRSWKSRLSRISPDSSLDGSRPGYTLCTEVS